MNRYLQEWSLEMVALEQAKTQAISIGLSSVKELLEKYNEMVVPHLLKALAEAIPGQVDDALLAVAEPMIKKQLAELISGIQV